MQTIYIQLDANEYKINLFSKKSINPTFLEYYIKPYSKENNSEF